MNDFPPPSSLSPLIPAEGWHVLHLFYQIEHTHWDILTPEEQRAAKTALTALIQEIRATEKTQLLTFSVVSPKADIAFMLLTPDLHTANAFEKRLTQSLGAGVLTPVYSYFSLTEWTEYSSTGDEWAARMTAEKGVQPGTPEMEQELATFREYQAKYRNGRLYPKLPDWPVWCFYPMSKRRGDVNNWFSLSHAERKKLMAGHAATGKTYAGKVLQLITGSSGLDEHEWGVTLFGKSTSEIKAIVYEMRFDEVSARFAEFGDFYIGLQLPLDELFRRVLL